MRAWLAMRLHALAGRLDPQLDFRNASSLSLTLEPGHGWVLREDGRGIPVWYRHPDYGLAWKERGPIGERVHACPDGGNAMTPCCRLPVFELPQTDRITLDPDMVTCGGRT